MKQFLAFSFLTLASLEFVLSGCSTKGIIGSLMPSENLILLDSKLKQGVSTKMDVQRLLGTPNGLGAALFPKATDVERLLGLEGPAENLPGIRYPKDEGPHEVWLYKNMEFESKSSAQNQLSFSQKILMIFFKKHTYEGYMWYSGSGVGYVK